MDRRLLLAGTALASTLAFANPTPADAQAIIIVSNNSINFTRNSDCVFVGTCLAATTIPFISPGASINLTNNGDLATVGIFNSTIFANTFNNRNAPITITNTGDLATAGVSAHGIEAITYGNKSDITINNKGDIATLGFAAAGISAYTTGNNSDISITNKSDIATLGGYGVGIAGYTYGRKADISITNDGDIATLGILAHGIYAYTYGNNARISVTNDREITTRGLFASGIDATTVGRRSKLTVENSGEVTTRGRYAAGVNATTYGTNADLKIVNSGDIESNGFFSDSILALTYGPKSSITIQNSGTAHANGRYGYGINAQTFGSASPITIENSGDVFGKTIGVYTYSRTSTTIINSGEISAGSGLAIDTEGASTTIDNTGLITGFIDLTGSRDTFTNMAGGTFNASETSDFGGGGDLFSNENGGTLRAADNFNKSEETRFVGLERFENAGLITMVDGRPRDTLRLSNDLGGTGLTFVGSGPTSTLAIDTHLGGPGSTSDVLRVEGSTFGRTRIAVNNTNQGSARFDPVGIPVVFVDGNVNANDFYLDKPIDAGFFEYDLFFVPTGSGYFELKNHTGGGAHLLPQLVTVTHDLFHNSTETWFDQSTDLRVLLARGNLCDDPGYTDDIVRCQELYNFTPGVWARGAGSWFEIDDSATTKASGRTYRHDLERDLDIWQVESGIDFGKRDLFADGDILVVGLLGGAVESTLDYEALVRTFQISSLEAGAYATYLRGGLFVDTLFKTLFSTVDPKDVRGFPETLDSTTYGFRTDAGYRFGGLQPGPFIEPLATIAVSWTHIDDFSRDGNAIDFNDDEEARGRLGLRFGTSTEVWEGTTMEPFVVGSLWGNLSGDHNATLTSTGRDFQLVDERDDVWGEVSAGVNFFNPGAQTAVFAKADYVFADETQGVSVKGGMRYNW